MDGLFYREIEFGEEESALPSFTLHLSPPILGTPTAPGKSEVWDVRPVNCTHLELRPC